MLCPYWNVWKGASFGLNPPQIETTSLSHLLTFRGLPSVVIIWAPKSVVFKCRFSRRPKCRLYLTVVFKCQLFGKSRVPKASLLLLLFFRGMRLEGASVVIICTYIFFPVLHTVTPKKKTELYPCIKTLSRKKTSLYGPRLQRIATQNCTITPKTLFWHQALRCRRT